MSKQSTRLRASEAQKAAFSRTMLRRLAELSMNQSELASRLGITRDAVSTYARMRSLPSPAVLKKMAVVLGISADELLPSRYEPEPEMPLAIEVRPNGMVRLRVDLECPMELGVEIVSRLQSHARTTTGRGR
jgi:transcriptional regulator with XRE-family HTH domain